MIFFLYGEDAFRIKNKLNELKEKFLRDVDPSGVNLSYLEGEKIKLRELHELISPNSLFSRKRMVIIGDILKNKDNALFSGLENLLKALPDSVESNIIIFTEELSEKEKFSREKGLFYKFLSKQKYSQQFKILNNFQIMAWIRESLESQQARMTQEASGLLAAAAGSNLWLLDNEINKLINYKKALGQHGKDTLTLIDIEDIRLLCQGQRELSIFPLTDAISSRNKRLAVKIIEEQLDADIPESYLLNMITRQFKVILQIREAIDNGSSTKKIISTLKIHPYVVQKGVVQARNFNIKYLKNVMKKLIEIDFSMKSGLSDIKTELSVLIAAL